MPIKIERILLPTDFSDCAKHALMYALSFATEYDARLVILHVVPQLNLPPELETSAAPLYEDMRRTPGRRYPGLYQRDSWKR